MKFKVYILILSLILVGCTNTNNMIDEATYDKEMVSLTLVYEKEFESMNTLHNEEINWHTDNVGSSSTGQAPVIDNDGIIYVTGQYEPFISAITDEGLIKWQILNNELLYGIQQLTLIDNYLEVHVNNDIYKYSKDGETLD